MTERHFLIKNGVHSSKFHKCHTSLYNRNSCIQIHLRIYTHIILYGIDRSINTEADVHIIHISNHNRESATKITVSPFRTRIALN